MPDTDAWTLASGQVIDLAMPDLYAILATVGAVPSQSMIEVLNLLDQEGVTLSGLDPAHKFLRIRAQIRGMYALLSHIIVRPRLVLDRLPGDGEIGPRDLSFNDVEAIYYRYFRGGYRPSPRVDPAAADIGGPAEPASDMPGRDTAESVSGND